MALMAGDVTTTCVSICLLTIYLTVCAGQSFELSILHTNDFHSRIEETNKYSGTCSAKDSVAGKCYGGSARIKTMVDEMRSLAPNTTILLSAGDQFQGTLWYTNFGGSILAKFMNLIGYDAMALGNHEFDDGVAGLVPFASQLNFSLVSSNTDFTKTPALQGLIPKSTVLTVNGHHVGVVGYTTQETAYLSSPETVTFTDELEAVQAEVDRLTSQNINKIIALGHAGFQMDMKLARELRDVDVVVGGHTNTFLYDGPPPSNEEPAGSYPYIVTNAHSPQGVLVVQDYAYGKYLGYLKVNFDPNGLVTGWAGNPILLNGSVAKDPAIEAEIAKDLPQLEKFRQTIIGQSHVLLEHTKCRQGECSLGNLVADAVMKENLRHGDDLKWTDVAIVLVNGGGLRTTIQKGSINMEMVLQVLPFRNTIEIVTLKGHVIWQVLEHSVSRLGEGFGGFLQMAGLRVVYDRRKDPGQRVVQVLATCTRCDVPKFEPLKMEDSYKVLMPNFLANGGDGYAMIPPNTLSKHILGDLMSSILVEYIKANSPIFTGLQDRIQYLDVIEDSPLHQCGVGNGASILSGGGIFFVLLLANLNLWTFWAV